VKRAIFTFFLFLVIFVLQGTTPVSAAGTCIKAVGNNVLCVGYLRCPVGIDIYCCDVNAQAECAALQAATQPTCVGLGGTCHLQSDICQTDLGPAGCPQFQTCGANCSPSTLTPSAEVCDYVTDATQNTKCRKCDLEKGVWTALGCIHTTPQLFIGEILRIGVSIGGGIAFLLILFGGFQILTSAGNPEKLNAGKELITSAITGLLIIIFSLFILRLIGFNIFRIPGFG